MSFIKKIISAGILGVVLYFGGMILYGIFFVVFSFLGVSIKFWENSSSVIMFFSYLITFFIVVKIFEIINRE